MPRPKRWADLVPGLATLVALGLGMAAVLAFARVGAVRGPTGRVYVAVAEARGVTAGTEVWIEGYRVGTVAGVDFRPASLDTTARILLALDVLEQHLPAVRRDADVRIRPGGSIIGVPVVAIGLGSAGAPPAGPGDTLVSRGPTYVERARADLAAAGAQIPAVVANLRLLTAQLTSARGTLGALGVTSASTMTATAETGRRLAERALRGPGTIGLALGGGGLAALAQAPLSALDSIRTLLASPSTSLGRFRRDSTLLHAVTALRADVDVLAARADSVDGTLGRAGRDRAVREQLAQTRTELDALIADLKRNPLRYVAF